MLSFNSLLSLLYSILGADDLGACFSLTSHEWRRRGIILECWEPNRVRKHSFTEAPRLLLCQSTQHFDVLIGSNQFNGETFDLTFELIDELRLRIVVLNRFVLDLGGFGGICQGHVVFFEVLVTRMDVRNHAAG